MTLWLDLRVRGVTTYHAITIELESNSRLPFHSIIVESLTVCRDVNDSVTQRKMYVFVRYVTIMCNVWIYSI